MPTRNKIAAQNSKKLLVLGPWVGEFSYEMSWWAPRLRKLAITSFSDYYALHFGYPGREIFYADFVDEYIPFDNETLAQLGPPTSGSALDPRNGLPTDCPMGLREFINREVSTRCSKSREIVYIAPRDLSAYCERGCMGSEETVSDHPYGEFLHLSPSASCDREAKKLLTFENDRDCIAMMPRLRMRGKYRDGEDWSAERWRELISRIISEMELNIAIIGIPFSENSPGSLRPQDLLSKDIPPEHLRYLHFQGPNSVELQIAVLKNTACSIYGGSGAATLAFFAGTPLFTMQTLENAWRLNFAWQRKLTDNHEKVKIFSRYQMGKEHFSSPAQEVYDSFRQFYYLHVKPNTQSAEALNLLSLGQKKESAGKIREAEEAFLDALQYFPEFAKAHAKLGQLAYLGGDHARAKEHFTRALEIDRDDRETVRHSSAFAAHTGALAQARKTLLDYLRTNRWDDELRAQLLSIESSDTGSSTVENSASCTDSAPLDLPSSYAQNNFGNLFYSLVIIYKPRLVVELGTYHGYSGLNMAFALRDLAENQSELHLVDLWDEYPYRHCSKETAQSHFAKKLSSFCKKSKYRL